MLTKFVQISWFASGNKPYQMDSFQETSKQIDFNQILVKYVQYL